MAIKYVSLCFALLVSVQVCLAGPTTTPAPVIPSFNDILQTAQSTVNSAKSHVEHMLGLPELKNVDQVVAAMRNASTDFSKKVTDVLATVKVEVDPNAKAAAAAIQKFYTEINKTTEELRKKIPDLQATELEKVWSKSLNSIIEEGTKLQNSLLTEAPHAQESMTKAAQSILESATKAANAFADQVHEAVGHDKHPEPANHHKA